MQTDRLALPGPRAFFAARRASWLRPLQLVRLFSGARVHASTAPLSVRYRDDRTLTIAPPLIPRRTVDSDLDDRRFARAPSAATAAVLVMSPMIRRVPPGRVPGIEPERDQLPSRAKSRGWNSGSRRSLNALLASEVPPSAERLRQLPAPGPWHRVGDAENHGAAATGSHRQGRHAHAAMGPSPRPRGKPRSKGYRFSPVEVHPRFLRGPL